MKKCKYCQNQISSQEKVCPNCGKKVKLNKYEKITVVIFIIFIGFLINVTNRDDNNDVDTEKNQEKSIQTSNNNTDEEENQKRMIQATAQIVLTNYQYKYDTSSSLKDWNINKMKYDDSYRWTASTYSDNIRLKWIFEWTGNNDDDLILIYLLVDGEEIVNDLK